MSGPAVLLDVDGTLLDTLPALRGVWRTWAQRHGLDGDDVFRVALEGVPRATFAAVAPELDAGECLAELHRIEDADAERGDCRAFPGAHELLEVLPAGAWAVVTSNYEHRVRTRFRRAALPAPQVVVDAEATPRGKPFPDGFELAAALLGRDPRQCLVLEDSASGVSTAKAAGMTVWAVNDLPCALLADRSFATLAEAVPAVLRWFDERWQPDQAPSGCWPPSCGRHASGSPRPGARCSSTSSRSSSGSGSNVQPRPLVSPRRGHREPRTTSAPTCRRRPRYDRREPGPSGRPSAQCLLVARHKS